MKRIIEDFMPKTFGGMTMWFNNLKQQVTASGIMVGLTSAQITDVCDLIQQCIDAINEVEIKRSALDQAITARDMLAENQMQEIRLFIGRTKKSVNYTPAIGAQWGILTNAHTIDTNLVKPALKLALEAGNVRISFRKKHMHGISIFGRQRGQLNWVKITQTSFSPFLDTRNLTDAGKPEAREYMALYHDGTKEIGQESDVTSILAGTQASNV
jgi:hypothetical protein